MERSPAPPTPVVLTYQHVRLESLAYVLPEIVVSSVEIERRLAPVYERLRLHEGRLELMSGIRERRFWEPGTMPSDAAARAGRRALDLARVGPERIGCLIHGGVSRDCLEPATASIVHGILGLSPGAMVCDISNACLGFANGLLTAAGMIELGQIPFALVVAAESSSQLVESTIAQLVTSATPTKQSLKSAFASLTIGSGAAAAILAHSSVSQRGHGFLGGVAVADSRHHELCRGSRDTGFSPEAQMLMSTDSEELLVEGCRLAETTWPAFKRAMAWENDDIQRVFTHQVGVAHRERLYASLEMDPRKDYSTLEFLGNVGSVSLPITMAMGVEASPPQNGESIALLGIGSGLNCIMLGVTW